MLLMLLVFIVLPGHLLLLVFEPLLPTEIATVLEHVSAIGMKSPEGALARLVGRTGNLDETVVEAEGMPDRVLPALLVLPIEREQVHDELVDLGQREHLGGRVLDGHGDQADVGVGWLRVRVTPAIGLVGSSALQGGIRRVWLCQG